MQRFLVPRSSLSSDAIQADLKAAHAATVARAAAQKKAQKRSDVCSQAPKKYWLQWGSAEKRQCVDIYVAKKMKGVQLHCGDPHPPQSTICLWGEAFADDRELDV